MTRCHRVGRGQPEPGVSKRAAAARDGVRGGRRSLRRRPPAQRPPRELVATGPRAERRRSTRIAFRTGHRGRAVAKYYAQRFPGAFAYDADENITIVAGATEGFAACIRALAAPGDVVAFFEPCHELYPSQLALFGMRPHAVTLAAHETDWAFDAGELEAALRAALPLQRPAQPHGTRFSPAERRLI